MENMGPRSQNEEQLCIMSLWVKRETSWLTRYDNQGPDCAAVLSGVSSLLKYPSSPRQPEEACITKLSLQIYS